jgi:hypothetical protein
MENQTETIEPRQLEPGETPALSVIEGGPQADETADFLFEGPPHAEHGRTGRRLIQISKQLLDQPDFELSSYLKGEVEEAFGALYGYPVPFDLCTQIPIPELGPDALDRLTDAEAAQLAAEVQIPIQNLVLAGANLRVVQQGDDGEKAIVVGPVALNFVLPLTRDASRAIARELTGGIELATADRIPDPAIEQLRGLGGHGGHILEPRR